MDVLVRSLNALLMVAMPLALGVLLSRRRGLPWRLFVVGAVTFLIAQVLHLPFNARVLGPLLIRLGYASAESGLPLLVVALAFGLSAAVFEEGARYLTYRYWLRDARTWSQGLMFGAGHGGIEAILLGGLAAYGLIQAITYRGADLSAIVPAENLPLVQAQLDAYWALPWYAALLGALERAFALCIQIGLALLVLQTFVRRSLRWLLAAMIGHTIVDALVAFGVGTWGVYITEGLVGLCALLSLGIIRVLRDHPGDMDEKQRHYEADDPARLRVSKPPEGRPPTPEQMDRSRYE